MCNNLIVTDLRDKLKGMYSIFRSRSLHLTVLLALIVSFLLSIPLPSDAYSRAERQSFQRSIVDYRSKLNPGFRKVKRKKTKYIIVHTSELGLKTTLRVVSKGKRLRSGRKTRGGHAHYVIARNGRTYRILDRKYRADHAGLSMWNGEKNISKSSIGIELTGYHYASISENQYRSVGILIDILQKVYGLDDGAVLTHSQVAYGRPNQWFRGNHRGRKRCAKNFVHTRAEVNPAWTYDPDVRAGRLLADPQLSEVFYGPRKYFAETNRTNIISRNNTAWSIAGEDYNARTTVYKLPDGKAYTGDQITSAVGWGNIPAKTVVLLHQEKGISLVESERPVKTISDSLTAWSLAGDKYNHKTTIYFLPSGQIKSGSMISDWDDLPVKTRLIVGYRGPYKIYEDRSAYGIAGTKYKDRGTVYYLPSQKLIVGDEIDDFTDLPAGTLMFLPIT